MPTVIDVRGRDAGELPQGFAFTLGLGIASLFQGYLVFVDPAGLLKILVLVLGVIFVLAGGFLVVDGWGMWNAARLIEARGDGDPAGP